MDNQRAASAACPKETMVLPGVPIRRAYGPHCSLKAQPQHPAVALRMPGWLASCPLPSGGSPSSRPCWVGDGTPARGAHPAWERFFLFCVLCLCVCLVCFVFVSAFPSLTGPCGHPMVFVWNVFSKPDASSGRKNASKQKFHFPRMIHPIDCNWTLKS